MSQPQFSRYDDFTLVVTQFGRELAVIDLRRSRAPSMTCGPDGVAIFEGEGTFKKHIVDIPCPNPELARVEMMRALR